MLLILLLVASVNLERSLGGQDSSLGADGLFKTAGGHHASLLVLYHFLTTLIIGAAW